MTTRTKPAPLTPAEIDRTRELARQGLSSTEAAKALGVSASTVIERGKRYGFKFTSQAESAYARHKGYAAEGLTVRQIAEAEGMTEGRVYNYFRDHPELRNAHLPKKFAASPAAVARALAKLGKAQRTDAVSAARAPRASFASVRAQNVEIASGGRSMASAGVRV